MDIKLSNIKGIRLAIVGSRDFNDRKLLDEALKEYKDKVGLVVSGGAKGADKLGEDWADRHFIPKLIFPADWNKHGKRAGFIRNEYIVNNCDAIVAFWDGKSNGTRNTLEICKGRGIPFKITVFEK